MSVTTQQTAGATAIRPFHIDVPQVEIDELRRRIAATRWPEQETVADDSQGVPLATMQELARYWASDYDWRPCQEKLNSLPQFITEIDGLDIHFIHVRSEHENALPLIITHGWPGSILEQLKIIDPLTNPTAHGASAADAFHLVIPSLPGHGFSAKPTATGWDPARIARALGRVDEAPRLQAVCCSGGRLGCGCHAGDGRTGGSGAAWDSLEHGRYRSRTISRRGSYTATRRHPTSQPKRDAHTNS